MGHEGGNYAMGGETVGRAHEPLRLGTSRVGSAVAVLTRAFGDDPIQRYVIPDGARRARRLAWSFGALVRYCLPHGGVYTTPDFGGVACWLPPGVTTTEPWGMIRSGMVLAPLKLGPAAFARFLGVTKYMVAERERVAPGPCWYLCAIGVEPSRQGEGIGGALLGPALARADADGLPCYLETQVERNVGFYERHGFTVASVGEPRGLRVWTMLGAPLRDKEDTNAKEYR